MLQAVIIQTHKHPTNTRTVPCTPSTPSGDATPVREADSIMPSGVWGSGEGVKLGLKGSGEGWVRGLGAGASAGGAWVVMYGGDVSR